MFQILKYYENYNFDHNVLDKRGKIFYVTTYLGFFV